MYHKENKMKIFNFNNPRHIEILKEELSRLKHIINEGQYYNEDDIWAAMTDEERKEALLSVPNGSNVADTYASVTNWNEIPDNIGDHIELSKYQLANNDRDMGRVMLRGIESIKQQFRDDNEKLTAINTLINKFCQKLGKTYDQLNVDQSIKLNRMVAQLKEKFAPAPQMNMRGNSGEDYGKGSRSWTGD